jgi:hypothetical protein
MERWGSLRSEPWSVGRSTSAPQIGPAASSSGAPLAQIQPQGRAPETACSFRASLGGPARPAPSERLENRGLVAPAEEAAGPICGPSVGLMAYAKMSVRWGGTCPPDALLLPMPDRYPASGLYADCVCEFAVTRTDNSTRETCRRQRSIGFSQLRPEKHQKPTDGSESDGKFSPEAPLARGFPTSSGGPIRRAHQAKRGMSPRFSAPCLEVGSVRAGRRRRELPGRFGRTQLRFAAEARLRTPSAIPQRNPPSLALISEIAATQAVSVRSTRRPR